MKYSPAYVNISITQIMIAATTFRALKGIHVVRIEYSFPPRKIRVSS
jgi:hypothetical protein